VDKSIVGIGMRIAHRASESASDRWRCPQGLLVAPMAGDAPLTSRESFGCKAVPIERPPR
jgi:hypothetical protein